MNTNFLSRKFSIFCCGLWGTLAPQAVRAADISALKLDNNSTAIFVLGDIVSSDPQKFRAEAQKYDDAVVFLESDGGSVAAAIEIGEAIRLKGFATAVINDSACNSACALIWLAGSPRALSKSGRVGFHAAYSDDSGTAHESGVANAMVGRYLTLLNLPERAVIFATTAPPTSLNWLTSTNYSSSGIDTKIIDDYNFEEDTSKKQQAYRASSQKDTDVWARVNNWYVYVDHTLDDGCFLISGFENNTRFRVGINSKDAGSYYLIIGNEEWKSVKQDAKYDLTFKFDDESPWDVPTKGVQMGDEVDLFATFTDAAFWSEFVQSRVLDVTKDGRPVTKISMAGTKAAFDELIQCQKYQNANTQGRDPFAR